MIEVHMFVSKDGKVFNDEIDCRNHEDNLVEISENNYEDNSDFDEVLEFIQGTFSHFPGGKNE